VPDNKYAFSGAVIYDGQVAHTDTAVVIEGSRVSEIVPEAALPRDIRRVDVSGRTIIPGLIDLHLHLTIPPWRFPVAEAQVPMRAVRQSLRALRAGLTTVRNLGGIDTQDFVLRDAITDGLVPGPRILAAGEFLRTTGGHGAPKGRVADGPDAVQRAVRDQINEGAEWLKIMCSGGFNFGHEDPERIEYSAAEVRAATETAHAAGRKVAAHAHGTTPIKLALENGVDSIEHGSYLDQACADLMLATGAFVVPTFAVYQTTADKPGHPMAEQSKHIVDVKRTSFDIVAARGIPWGVGSDGGSGSPIELILDELIFLVEDLGLTPADAIRQATAVNADLLGLTDAGVIRPGSRADLVVVDGNPLSDIRDVVRIERTVCGGRVYDWTQLAEPFGLWQYPVDRAETVGSMPPSRDWWGAYL
jgi:imidazolonepropionase-like amidohydrolase